MFMPKFPTLVLVVIAGLVLAGCTKVTTGQAGVSSPLGSPSATNAASPCPKPVSARKGAVDD
ncbi:MAG TPA: hypothetical protein DCR52_05105, partial [Actinobacteria bacterium]|nr:hypothetical protein [Actinomycetota bacterium]